MSLQTFFNTQNNHLQQQPAGNAAASNYDLLPYPGTRGAPEFDGDPYKVKMFLDDFDKRATKASLAAGEWKEQIIAYVTKDIRPVWTSLEEFSDANKDWAAYKTAILAQYPDAKTTQQYTLVDLEQLILRWANKGISNEHEVNQYRREFLSI
ncbi:hypothetical protein EXIGLDRAFT_610854, partial [Exidia glandulosa HHB12029]